MTPLVDALQASGIAADVSLGGRWAEFQGERRRVYVFETARGGYYTWCDEGPTRAVEFYPNPHEAILAGRRRAAEAIEDQPAGPARPDLAATVSATAAAPPSPARSPARRDRWVARARLPVRGRRLAVAWGTAAIVALAVLALLLATTLHRGHGPACPDEPPTVGEVLRDARCYYGTAVSVGGEVDQVIAARAFSIREALGGARGNATLLVISARPLPPLPGRPAAAPIVERDRVQVGGIVQPFVLATIEREARLDLDDAAFATWAGQPTVVAQSVALTVSAAGGSAAPATGGDGHDESRLRAPIITAILRRNVPRTSPLTLLTPPLTSPRYPDRRSGTGTPAPREAADAAGARSRDSAGDR